MSKRLAFVRRSDVTKRVILKDNILDLLKRGIPFDKFIIPGTSTERIMTQDKLPSGVDIDVDVIYFDGDFICSLSPFTIIGSENESYYLDTLGSYTNYYWDIINDDIMVRKGRSYIIMVNYGGGRYGPLSIDVGKDLPDHMFTTDSTKIEHDDDNTIVSLNVEYMVDRGKITVLKILKPNHPVKYNVIVSGDIDIVLTFKDDLELDTQYMPKLDDFTQCIKLDPDYAEYNTLVENTIRKLKEVKYIPILERR